MACNPEKLEYKQGELFYEGVEKSTAQKLGQYLEDEGYFNDNVAATVKLSKSEDHYIIQFIMKEIVLDNPHIEAAFQYYLQDFRDLLDNESVIVQICDDRLKVLKEIKE